MSRSRITQPAYQFHVSGQAVVSFNGTIFYLGRNDSPESHAKYRKLIAEYIATRQTPTDETHKADTPITVFDVTAEAMEWIKEKFRNAQTHRRRYERLSEQLAKDYGDVPASEFGPRRLASVRNGFVAGGNCRRYANSQTRCVVAIFRYALSRELIKADTLMALQSLDALPYGQTAARESKPMQPANIGHVRATAKFLSPPLKAMVRTQAATGMRPSELVAMRPAEIDRSSPT